MQEASDHGDASGHQNFEETTVAVRKPTDLIDLVSHHGPARSVYRSRRSFAQHVASRAGQTQKRTCTRASILATRNSWTRSVQSPPLTSRDTGLHYTEDEEVDPRLPSCCSDGPGCGDRFGEADESIERGHDGCGRRGGCEVSRGGRGVDELRARGNGEEQATSGVPGLAASNFDRQGNKSSSSPRPRISPWRRFRRPSTRPT